MHCFKFKASAPQPSIIGSASLRCPSKPGARPGSKGTAIVAVETAVQVHQGSSREGISQGRHEPKPAMSGVPQVVPTYIAENAIRLYRDCLRLADYLGSQHGNRAALRQQVRAQFRQNMHERHPERIAEQKQAAVRALSNFMMHEAVRMARESRQAEPGNPFSS